MDKLIINKIRNVYNKTVKSVTLFIFVDRNDLTC